MKVKVKLFAMLGRYLPPGSSDNEAELEVLENASAKSVIDSLNLPEKLAHLVLLNGAYLPPGERENTVLKDGDAIAIWPPIAGGAAAPLTLDREMSISHNDFLRVLPSAALQATGTREYSLAGRKATIGAGGKKVEITLSKESERRLGAFRFPLTKVGFVFHGYTKAEMEAFLTRFSRAYQRVGG